MLISTYGIRKKGGDKMLYKVDVITLKKIMVERGLEKIIDLSKKSSIDRNTLSKILNGDLRPSATVIEKLMIALEIPPKEAGEIFFKQYLRNT